MHHRDEEGTQAGVAPADLLDVATPPDRTATPPEWAWWEFDIDDVTAVEGDVMRGGRPGSGGRSPRTSDAVRG